MIRCAWFWKKNDYQQIIVRAAALSLPPPLPPIDKALRSNKPKNIYRFVLRYPCKCRDFVNHFIPMVYTDNTIL
jgi:hypothetical protein